MSEQRITMVGLDGVVRIVDAQYVAALEAKLGELKAMLAAMEELKEAVEAFKADDTWKFDPAHIGRGLMTWGEVLTALAAAQQEQGQGNES